MSICHAADPRVASARYKFDLIESGKARPGSVITFSSPEINAFGRYKAPEIVAEGLRQPRIELGNSSATGYALIDFLKVRHGTGVETNWLMAKIIEGEKPVKVVAVIQSGNGRARITLQRVEIGGLAVKGATLDFLIHTFFLPLYPNAKIDQTFELEDRIDRIEVIPTMVRVYIKK